MKVKALFKGDGIYHVLIWLLLIVPHGYSSIFIIKSINLTWYILNLVATDGVMLSVVYANVFYFIPEFYRKKKYKAYSIWIFLMIGIYMLVSTLFNEFIVAEMKMTDQRSLWDISYSFFNVSRYLVISFLLFGMREKQEQKKVMDQIRVEKLNTEVNYLRAQINPHFLFNTLNNLYGLALQKSDKTPEVILRLSKMMDFMLYELDGSRVQLKRDVENLQNYIEIEKLRQGNKAKISFDIKGNISDQTVEPLLLLPLVENAFKHGVNKFIDGAYLDIELIVTQEKIIFSVRNNFKEGTSSNSSGPGIGLNNLKKRLSLFYNERHSLAIRQEFPVYEAILKINLI